ESFEPQQEQLLLHFEGGKAKKIMPTVKIKNKLYQYWHRRSTLMVHKEHRDDKDVWIVENYAYAYSVVYDEIARLTPPVEFCFDEIIPPGEAIKLNMLNHPDYKDWHIMKDEPAPIHS